MVETALAMALARAGVVKSPADAIPLLEPRGERPAQPRLTSADVTWLADFTAAKIAAKSGEGADNQSDDIDPSKLSLPELEAEVVARRDLIIQIKDQLADDEAIGLPRGPDWRIRARDKIEWITTEIRQLELVLKLRRAEDHEREKAEWSLNTPAGRQAANVAAHLAAEQRRAKKREAHEAWQKTADRAFQSAAYDLLGKEECLKIWQRARVMFPDDRWS